MGGLRQNSHVGHAPSDEQWGAIRDLLDHLEGAAHGNLRTALHVSTIPAGVGKSQAVAAFARALMQSPGHDFEGMLILVNRIAEAEDMAARLAAHRTKVCIFTSRPDVNDMGDHMVADHAQVCITTQAALKVTFRELHGAPFGDASKFHYRGARRAVVAWDESFAFNRPVTLDADTAGGLARAMRRQSDDAANMLKRWTSDLDNCAGGLCSVPDFEGVGMGIDFRRLEDDVGDNDELVAQAKALAVVSGDVGFVTRQGTASILITHYPEIPPSLMPVVVTDASARVNQSYTQMAQRIPLVWLKDAPKTYQNMTIRIVPTAASRSVYRDTKTFRGRELIDMAVRYIESVPGDDVLVIGYRGRFTIRGLDQPAHDASLERALKDRLKPEDRDRVKYLAYGRHTATNAFKDVRRVLLLGLNFVPKAAGHAASGAALDLDLIDNHPTTDQIKDMREGMLMDSTLQALLRGHARVSVGGDCGVMEAVVPQTTQTGLSRLAYASMFPGAHIVLDNLLLPARPLRGRLKALDTIVVRRLRAGEREMTNGSICSEMRMSDRNFRALVQRPEWQERRAQLGLNPQKLTGRKMGLRLTA